MKYPWLQLIYPQFQIYVPTFSTDPSYFFFDNQAMHFYTYLYNQLYMQIYEPTEINVFFGWSNGNAESHDQGHRRHERCTPNFPTPWVLFLWSSPKKTGSSFREECVDHYRKCQCNNEGKGLRMPVMDAPGLKNRFGVEHEGVYGGQIMLSIPCEYREGLRESKNRPPMT